MNQTTFQSTLGLKSIGKVATFTLLGATACFAIFVLMGKLIENDNLSFAEPKETFLTELLAVQEEKPTIIKPNVLPPPPIAKAPPPPPPIPMDTINDNLLAMNTNFGIKIPPTQVGPIVFEGRQDNSATPIVRVQPKYPMKAARDGIEGWVSLSFSIDTLGRVIDIAVVDAHPSRVFDNEAKKALKRWKYKPQIKDGKAITLQNQQIMLEFNLGQS